MADFSYEFYTIHVDSLTSSTGNVFTSHLFRPIKDVVQVSVLTVNFDASTSVSNVAYLYVDQLTSMFNENTGERSGDSIVSNPINKDRTRGALARFNVASSGRTIYNQQDYSTQTQFIHPIEKIDRINVRLFDENGDSLITISNTFVSFRFTCMRDNLSPISKKEKKRTK